MGWHTRQGKRYYFRSERRRNRVHKIYFGTGPVADFAARADRLRQHEKKQDRERWRQQKRLVEESIAAFRELDSGAELIRDAVLLAVGFYRPGRHAWRIWQNGRRALERID